MIRVTICAIVDPVPASLVGRLRTLVEGPIGWIAVALAEGQPLFDADLLARPREETFARLRSLLHVLETAGASIEVAENGRAISAEVLRNIMEASEESAACAARLDEIGHS